jgi:hypothetical protein
MQLEDGRVFHYCETAGALTCGKMALSVLPTTDFDICALSTVAANGRSVVVTHAGSPSVAANDFAEGVLVVQAATTGGGQCVKIKASSAPSSKAITLTLHDPLVLGASSDATGEITRCVWKDVTHLANDTGTPAGVPLVAIGSGAFGWLQTWGTCALLAGGNGGITDRLIIATTAGEVITLTIATNGAYTGTPVEIGHSLAVTITDAKYHPTYLELYP